jgi:hypothetical protein
LENRPIVFNPFNRLIQPLRCFLAPLTLICVGAIAPSAIALPPPEDVPEEVLRVEMMVDSRDRMGQPIAPGAYVQLQQTIDRQNQANPQISEDLQSLLLQLRILNVIKSIIPFP